MLAKKAQKLYNKEQIEDKTKELCMKQNYLLTAVIISIAIALPVAFWANLEQKSSFEKNAKIMPLKMSGGEQKTDLDKMPKAKDIIFVKPDPNKIKKTKTPKIESKIANIKLKSEYPARDNFDSGAIALMRSRYPNPNINYRHPEAFVLYRLFERSLRAVCYGSMPILWKSDGRFSSEYHDNYQSYHYFKKEGGACFEMSDRPGADTMILGKDRWPRWVLAVNGEQLEVEWVDVEGVYHHENISIKEDVYEGKFFHISDDVRSNKFEKITSDRGYVRYDGPVLKGFEDGTARPNSLVTRAEFVTALSRIMKIEPNVNLPDEYLDVKGHWAEGYIKAFDKLNIINGYPNGNFGPNDNITNEQMMKILVSTWNHTKYNYVNISDFEEGLNSLAKMRGIQADMIEQSGSGAVNNWIKFAAGELEGWNLPESDWSKSYVIASFPIIKEHPIIVDHDFEKEDEIKWKGLVKRYQVAYLFNLLTGREGFSIDYNISNFKDMASAFNRYSVDNFVTVASMDLDNLNIADLSDGNGKYIDMTIAVRAYQRSHR